MKIERLSLDILNSFIVFVESDNMVAAAEKLGVSQPLLTKHLQLLETGSDDKVFTFEGRRKVCTRYGHELYAICKRHLENLQNSLHQLSLEQKDPSKMLIRVAGRKELLEHVLPRLEFIGRVHLLPMSGPEALSALEKSQAEIAISQHDLDSHNFVQKSFLQERFQIAAPESWKLSGKRLPDLLEELLQKPYLSYGASDPAPLLYQFHEIKELPSAFRSFPSWPAIVEMLRKKMGWAIVPQMFLKDAKGLQLIEIPDKALTRTNFRMFYPKELAKLPWFQEVIKTLA